MDLLSVSNSEFGISQDSPSLVPPSQSEQSASPRTVAPVTLILARDYFKNALGPLMYDFDGGKEFDAVKYEIFKPNSGVFFLGFNEDKHGLILRVGDNTLDIFNSGFGLDYGHMAIGKKCVTVVHLEVDEGDDGRYRKSADDIINDISRLSKVKELYDLPLREESHYRVGRLSVNDKAQRYQKQNNCYIECYFSYFRQVLSDEVYLKLRQHVFQKVASLFSHVKTAPDMPMIAKIITKAQEKADSREAKLQKPVDLVFLRYVRSGNARLLNTFLEGNKQVVSPELFRSTFNWAVACKHNEIVNIFLNHSPDIFLLSLDQEILKIILCDLAQVGNFELISKVLFHIQDESEIQTLKIALHYASENGHLEVVVSLAEEIGHDAVRVAPSLDILHYAAQNGHADVVKYLIDKVKMPPNQVDSDGKTPLHYACESGHLEVVVSLAEEIGHDAVRVAPSLDILHYAAQNGHADVVKYLIDKVKMPPNQVDSDGKTPLHYACESGYGDIVSSLFGKSIKKIKKKHFFTFQYRNYSRSNAKGGMVTSVIPRSLVPRFKPGFLRKNPGLARAIFSGLIQDGGLIRWGNETVNLFEETLQTKQIKLKPYRKEVFSLAVFITALINREHNSWQDVKEIFNGYSKCLGLTVCSRSAVNRVFDKLHKQQIERDGITKVMSEIFLESTA